MSTTFNPNYASLVQGQTYEGPYLRKIFGDNLPGWNTYKEVRNGRFEPIRTGRRGRLPSLWKFLG